MVTSLPPPAPPTVEPKLRPPPATRSLGYQPALDGLRAISVLAVLLYHADIAWIPGGFLGVDVFFVISGFLITALLVDEFQRHGSIDRPRFWMRRARRLLPALFAVIIAVVFYTALVLPDELAKLRGDVIAALTYTTNWFLIFSQQSYFEAFGRPSPLRHLWSLAVEEQFYILWPIVMLFALRAVRGRASRLFGWMVIASLASTILMALLYNPDADPSRVYYGTDTRATGLLLGAALACVWTPSRHRRSAANAGTMLDVVGGIGLLVLIWFFLNAGEFDPWLYRGGFFALSLVTVVLIAVVVHPQSRLMKGAFSVAPLTYIGLRSYGIYLWHWPIFVFMTPGEVGFDGAPLFIAKFGLTFLLADLSFRFIEMPIRKKGLAPIKRFLRIGAGGGRGAATWLTAPALACVAVLGVLVVDLGSAKKPPEEGNFGPGSEIELPADDPTATSVPAPGSGSGGAAAPAPTAAPTAAANVPSRIAVVGDSVGMTLVRNAPPEATKAFKITDASIEGCGIVEGTVVTKAKFRWNFNGCSGWAAKWAQRATAAKAQVAVVSLGAWDIFDLKQGDTLVPFGTATHDQHLRMQLQSGIDALKAAGVKVALLEVPCYRPVAGGGLTPLPERGEDARTRHLNDLLKQAAAADPEHVVYITGPQQYCTDPALATDLGHRWDGVHYYKPGAQLVWDTIIPQLQGLRV